MKKLRILVVLLLVVVLVLPFLVGFEIENRYRGILAEFEAAGYQLDKHEFQRGFYQSSSESVLSVPVNVPNAEIKSLSVTIKSQLQHGPYNLNGWQGWLTQISTNLFYDGQALVPGTNASAIVTTIEFNSNGRTLIDIPALEKPARLENNLTFEFSGANGSIDFNLVAGSMDIKLVSNGLNFYESGKGRIDIGKISLNSNSQRGLSELMLGSGVFIIDAVRINDIATGFKLGLQTVKIDADTVANGSNVDFVANYGFQKLTIDANSDAQQYGPALLSLEMKSIPAEVIARLQENIRELQQKQVPPQQQGMAVMGVMMSVLPAVMEQNPQFNIPKFSLQTPQGLVTANLSLKAQDMKVTDLGAAPLMVEKLLGKAELSLPENLVRQMMKGMARQQIMQGLKRRNNAEPVTAKQLKQLVDQQVDSQLEMVLRQGFIEKNGDKLQSSASLKAGLLSVNGKMIPLAEMAK